MATQRIILDTKGNNILSIFEDNMAQLGALNQLAATTKDTGVYHGPGEEVNINYPRDGTSYARMGRSPGAYEAYYVKEITLKKDEYDPTGLFKTQSGVKSILTKEDNDGQTTRPFAEHTVVSFQGKSPTTLLQQYGMYSNEIGPANPSKFMELKGRKSLYTLLEETRAAFFDSQGKPAYKNPAAAVGDWTYRGKTNIANEYYGGPGYDMLSYDYKYMSQQGDSFVDPPSKGDVQNQALAGFVLGQTLGPSASIGDRIANAAHRITRSYYEDLIAGTNDDNLKRYYQGLLNRVSPHGAAGERISQLYVPGWGRPAENWPSQKPISENLNQNILLPPSLGEDDPVGMKGYEGNGEGIPGFGDTAATFRSLYTRNRAGAAGGVNVSNPVFNNGKIAGAPINLMQEPLSNRSALYGPDFGNVEPTNEDEIVFSYERDDAEYLTYRKLQAGYRSNGPGSQRNPATIEPAVVDVSNGAVSDETTGNEQGASIRSKKNALQVISWGNGQHFPFTFSTVNKKNNRLQVCFLQASIQSLGESYTPTWASKHFFGRSEQVHTYTFTDRTIDLSFSIYADEIRQLQNIYERVLWLAQQTYPDYDDAHRLSQGPIVAFRIGDLFQYKTGIIRSLSYDWMFNGGKWEVTSGVRMPQGVTVTMSYQIIHDTIPNRDTDFYGGIAGGLNAGTMRSRRITGKVGGNVFDPFNESQVEDVGIGNRFLPDSVMDTANDQQSYLDWVGGQNYTSQFPELAKLGQMIPGTGEFDTMMASLPAPTEETSAQHQREATQEASS